MFKLAVFQGGEAVGVTNNLGLMSKQVQAAKCHGVHLILFAECFIGGYVAGDDFAAQSLETDGATFGEISNIAKSNGIAIAFGYIERYLDASGALRLANACAFIDENGKLLLNYRKTHLWQAYEQRFFERGTCLGRVIEFKGAKIAMMICYDVEFPEVTRTYALQGANVFLVPTALTTYANRVGREECVSMGTGLEFVGNSVIVAPNGDVLARGSQSKFELLMAEIDLESKEVKDAISQNPYLTDRRPELYKL